MRTVVTQGNGFARHGDMHAPIEPRRYFLACEGKKTEHSYFRDLCRCGDKIGIRERSIVLLKRDYWVEDVSDPCQNLRMILSEFCSVMERKQTVDVLVSHVSNTLVDKGVLTKRKGDRACVKIVPRILAGLEQGGFQGSYFVIDDGECPLEEGETCVPFSSFQSTFCSVFKNILEDLPVEGLPPLLRSALAEERVEFQQGYDVLCMIFDRDAYASFTDERYEKFLSVCDKNHILPCITNPCFEFWILLHFDGCRDLDLQRLKSDRQYVYSCLHEVHPGYSKQSVNIENLVDKVSVAIANEKLFCEDVVRLKDTVGSNVGCLITRLISNY